MAVLQQLKDAKKVVLGIGGGVGPSAGVGLHQKIIDNTQSGGTDQGHFSVIHISRSAHVQYKALTIARECA